MNIPTFKIRDSDGEPSDHEAVHIVYVRQLWAENAKLRAGYLDLLGQVEQGRDGFGIYRNSPSMDTAVKTARMILLPSVAVSHGASGSKKL